MNGISMDYPWAFRLLVYCSIVARLFISSHRTRATEPIRMPYRMCVRNSHSNCKRHIVFVLSNFFFHSPFAHCVSAEREHPRLRSLAKSMNRTQARAKDFARNELFTTRWDGSANVLLWHREAFRYPYEIASRCRCRCRHTFRLTFEWITWMALQVYGLPLKANLFEWNVFEFDYRLRGNY